MTVCNCCGRTVLDYSEDQEHYTEDRVPPESAICHCEWEAADGPVELIRDDSGVTYGWGEGWHCLTHRYYTDQAEREVGP